MTPLRIGTFNLLHGQPLARGRPLPPPGDRDAAAGSLARAVTALDADVLALQEVDRYQPRSGLVDQAAVAAAALGAGDWRFAAALHGRPAPVAGWIPEPGRPALRVYGPDDLGTAAAPSYGTALLTRLPVRHWRARRFAPAPFGLPLRVAGRRGLTPVPDEPRAALAAVLVGERGPFTVVAAHLSFVPGWNVAQLAGVRRWISDLPRPHLVLGDFNLVGAVPRTVLGGAAVVDGVVRAPHRSRRAGDAPSGPPPPRGGRVLREARTERVRRISGHRGSRQTRVRLPSAAKGWVDLARAPTYPAHRPAVQFDHVLAVGIGRNQVGRASTPLLPVSDHRPLLVDIAL